MQEYGLETLADDGPYGSRLPFAFHANTEQQSQIQHTLLHLHDIL